MDKITQRLFGVAAVIAALGFLIQTTTPAIADSPTTTYATGKYGVVMSAFSHEGDQIIYAKVWNTETGQSKMYEWSTGKTALGAVPSAFGIPAYPLN